MNPMIRPSLAALAAAFLTCTLPGTHASAQDVPADLRIEAETGRSRAHFPPHRFFDHQHLRLEIDIPTMAEAKLSARASLTVEAIGSARSEIFLFAKGPKLTRAAVKFAGGGETPATFRETPGGYTISLPTPLNPGERAEVLYDYDLDFSGNTGTGLTRVAPKDSGGATDTAPMIFSQGQPEENRRWIPGHDFPNERLSTELIVTVESGYEVISNGRLVERTEPSPGRTRFHWRQAQPHPLYLTALAVGKFVSIDLMNPPERHAWIMPAGLREKVVNDRGEAIPMRVWLPAGQEEQGWKLYGATPAMVAFFNDKLGQPYPWDKYDQIVVRNFPWGGMENVTATIMYEGSLNGEKGDQDDLIAHELAHHWFGDLITCNSWEHLWLNEGWATYAEALWAEHVGGRNAYMAKVRQNALSLRRSARGYWPAAPAMASRYYDEPDSNFMKADDVYSKGSIVLHMLRQRLGDEAFFKGVREYVQRFKFREVETDDFRRVMEEVSGQSLERFFEQWVYRPGMPRLEIDLAWSPGTRTDDAGQPLPEGTITVTMEQSQTIDALNPAYALQLPIRFVMPDGASVWEYMTLDTRTGQATFTLPDRPARVSVDPNITHLSINRIRTPLPEPERPAASPTEKPAETPSAPASEAPAGEPTGTPSAAPAIEPK